MADPKARKGKGNKPRVEVRDGKRMRLIEVASHTEKARGTEQTHKAYSYWVHYPKKNQ